MKVASFDIGIKNMAYCIFDIPPQNSAALCIVDWNSINLMETPDTVPPIAAKCGCIIEPPKKKASKKTTVQDNGPKLCLKKAKYQKNGVFYCEKHAAQSSQYILPKREYQGPQLKKKKLADLIELSKTLGITMENLGTAKWLKNDVLKLCQEFIDTKCFELLVDPVAKLANDVNLIQIGKSIKENFGKLESFRGITHVVIENQISTIATRMKTIQGMLAQYFIMTDSNIVIEFVSSMNKLKQFNLDKQKDAKGGEKGGAKGENLVQNNVLKTDKKAGEGGGGGGEEVAEKSDGKVGAKNAYKEHKKDAVLYCSQLLQKKTELHQWKSALETKKKDDLADCFLQGIWYLSNKKHIDLSTWK